MSETEAEEGSSAYHSSESSTDNDDGVAEMPMPYSYEPSSSDSGDTSDSSNDDDSDRLADTSWCTCDNCRIMATSEESVCCKEIARVAGKLNELCDPNITCITHHPGFNPVCLNVWVLQASYFQYRQEHGIIGLPPTLAEKYRYTAYRQMTRWCYGWLGRNIRVVLPACAVTKIRATFPSDTYTGFNYPAL